MRSVTHVSPRCVVCRSPLVESIMPRDVVTIDGRRIQFRRHTDYVLCRSCMSLYRAIDMRRGRLAPVTDEELVPAGRGPFED